VGARPCGSGMAPVGTTTSVLYGVVTVPARTTPSANSDGRVRLHLGPEAVAVILLGVVIGIAVGALLVSARSVLAMFVAASIAAALIDPAVEFLSRSMRRWLAVIIALVFVVGAIGWVSYAVLGDLNRETKHLQSAAPRAAREIEQSKRFGEVARKFHLAKRVQDAVDNLRSRTNTKAQTAAMRVGRYFIGGILMLFMLSWGPRYGRAGLAQIRDSGRRARAEAIAFGALRRARHYVLWSLLQAVGVGLIAFAAAKVAALPAPTPLALLVAVGSFMPYVGIVVGGIPTLLIAGGLASPGAVELLVALLLGLQMLQVFVAQPFVTRRSLYAGPAVLLLTGLLGYAVYGAGGAMFAPVLAVFGLAVADAYAAEFGDGPVFMPSGAAAH
jgi:predicted PurR-regulated permease PerM